jgi:adenine-specific DNA-methyltransferase
MGSTSRVRGEWQPVLQAFARDMRQAPTVAEARLWYFLRNRRLDGIKFRRQHPIGPYIIDFISIDHGIAVEIDGGQHALADEEKRDAARDAFLFSRGFRVLRFWNDEVLNDTMSVLERIWHEALDPASSPGLRGEQT